jgi:3-ketosteroid 9alpha-monooxygenase subunit B
MNAAAPSRYLSLRVRAVREETADARSLLFDIPAGLAARFAYQPGQFLTLRLPVGGHIVPRCYSMSSAPGQDEGLRVTVKRVAGGCGSNWICDHLKAGDLVDVLAPAGVFTPRGLDGDFLLFAGGSGITPVYSILRAALAGGGGRILLVYANRDVASVIFRAELQGLASAHPQRLQVVHWLDALQGVPSAAQLAALARGWSAAQAFVCGPAPFMAACEAALAQLPMAPERIRVERYASLPDEAAPGAVAGPAGRADPGPGQACAVQARYRGQWLHFDCAAGESVLEAALRANIELPHSCMAGMCASCMCQVESGAVHLRANDALDQRDLDRGWTLSCQALPASPTLTLKFAE